MDEQGFTEDEWSLLGADTATTDHDEGVVDLTVVWEATQWGDVLFGQIVFGGSVVLDGLGGFTDSVDLLVDFGSVMVTQLTCSWDFESDSLWMPGTDTADLSETSVSLSWQLLGVPSLDDAGETFTLGDTEDVDHFVLGEDLVDIDWLFEETLGEVDLFGDGFTTVDLDFEDVSLLLSEVQQGHLGVGNDTDDLAVLLQSVESGFWVVVSLLAEELGVLCEGLLLGVHPALVESSLGFLLDVLGPDGGEGSETSWGFDVTNDTDDDHWWGFDDGDWLVDLLVVELGALSVNLSGDVGHTGLESHECGQVAWLGVAVLWEGSYSATMMSGSLSGKETEGTITWLFVLSVGHVFCLFSGI